MMRLCLAVSLSLFTAAPVIAQEGPACAAKAVGKDGKALAGAAKASSMKKCCEAGAVGQQPAATPLLYRMKVITRSRLGDLVEEGVSIAKHHQFAWKRSAPFPS